MGSSSKKRGSGQQAQAAPPPPPVMASTGLPDGAQTSYFVNQSEIPQGATGLVRPNAAGIGLNRVMAPPPPPPRMQLAQQMQPRPVYEGRGARGMSGAYGNSSRSGRSNDR